MASKKIVSGSEEFMMFNEFWNLYQKYYEPENNNEYWDDLIADVNEFFGKYQEFPMAIEMALGLICCFESKDRRSEYGKNK